MFGDVQRAFDDATWGIAAVGFADACGACAACGESDEDATAASGTPAGTTPDTTTPTQSTEALATTEPAASSKATTPATSASAPTLSATTTPAVPATTAPDPNSNLTPSHRNAVRSAQSYLDLKGFSRQGLIDQLSSEYGDQYPVEDATIAVDSLGADWTAQAGRSAQSYLDLKGFSRQGLIDQLSSAYGDQFHPRRGDLRSYSGRGLLTAGVRGHARRDSVAWTSATQQKGSVESTSSRAGQRRCHGRRAPWSGRSTVNIGVDVRGVVG
jgi:hypothetical protein